MALTLFLSLWNVTAGMPSAAQAALVCPDAKTLAGLAPVMMALREEVYEHYTTLPGNDIRKFYRPTTDRVAVTLNGAPAQAEKWKLHALRSALLQMRYPDEPKTWASLARLKPGQGEFNTHLYHYGGLYVYSCGAAVKAASMLHFFPLASTGHYLTHPEDARRMYITPRLWAALVTVFAIPLIFLCGRRLYGHNAGIAAAVLLAVLPAVSVESHYFKPYAFSLAFVLATLYFSLRFLESDRPADLLLSSVFAGLSAGALLMNGAFLFCPAAALLLSGRRNAGARAALLLGVVLGFAAAFIVSNPHWLMAPKEAFSELTTQQSDIPFRFGLSRLAHHFFLEFYKLFSLPLYCLAAAGLLYSLLRPGKAELVMLAAFVPYYLYIANQFPLSPHYAVPLIPFAVLMASRLAAALSRKTVLRPVVPAALALVAAFALADAVYYDLYIGASQKNLLAAGAWINKTIPAGETIGTSRPLHFSYGGFPPFSLLDYRVNETENSRYVIIIDNDDPLPRSPEFARNYRPEKTFRADVPVLGRVFKNDLYFMWDHDIRIFKQSEVTG